MPLIKSTNPTPVPEVKADAQPPKNPPKVEKPIAAKTGEAMTRADWDAKDRRISRAGLFQAALQSPALMQYAPSVEAYMELVVRTADAGLAYVNLKD